MNRESDTDKDREDRRLLKKYNILFRGPAYPWPTNHMRCFQQIAVLGNQRFSAYYDEGDLESSLEIGEKLWKSSIKARAVRLANTADRLARTQPTEMKWRLDIEKIVYKRFELEIEW